MTGHLSAPMVFQNPANHHGFDPEYLNLGYRYEVAKTGQPVNNGRIVLTPGIDLNNYDREAVIDWVEIGFATKTEHQSGNIGGWVNQWFEERGSSSTAYAKGPTRKGKHQGREFILRIQEPEPRELIGLMKALEDRYDLELRAPALFTVPGIEISLDFYAKRSAQWSDEAREVMRWRMSEVLRKHARVSTAFLKDWADAPRFTVKKGVKTATSKLIATTGVKPTKETMAAIAGAGLSRVEALKLQPGCYRQPPMESTVYIGKRDNEISLKIMDKIGDKRNEKKGYSTDLPPKARRSRIEVTIMGRRWDDDSVLGQLRLSRAKDLFGYRYDTLNRLVFNFHRPTLTPQSDGVRPCEREWEIFRRAGWAGLERFHRIEHKRQEALWRGGEIAERPAPLGGKAGSLAYTDLNDRMRKSLLGLSRRWDPERWPRWY